MKKNWFSGILIVLGMIVLYACTSTGAATPSATDNAVAIEAAATSAPEADECLICHTDKQRLIDTAKVVEEVAEAESKGVG